LAPNRTNLTYFGPKSDIADQTFQQIIQTCPSGKLRPGLFWQSLGKWFFFGQFFHFGNFAILAIFNGLFYIFLQFLIFFRASLRLYVNLQKQNRFYINF